MLLLPEHRALKGIAAKHTSLASVWLAVNLRSMSRKRRPLLSLPAYCPSCLPDCLEPLASALPGKDDAPWGPEAATPAAAGGAPGGGGAAVTLAVWSS